MATVSMYDATHGYAAKTTAVRNAKGEILGNSQGSNYARQQEAQKAQEAQKYQAAPQVEELKAKELQATPQQTQAYPTTSSFIYGQKAEEIQKRASEYRNPSGSITIDTSEETVKRARASGLDVSYDRSTGKINIYSGGVDTQTKLEAIHKQTYTEAAEKWKGVTIQKTVQAPEESLVSKVASSLGVKSQLDTANKNLSAHIPTLGAFQKWRDTNLEKVGLLDERQKVTEAIRSNSLTAGFQDWSVHGYQGLKETPVNFAAEQGTLVVGGAVGGAIIKGVGIAGKAGLVKAGYPVLAKAVEPTIYAGLAGLTAYEVSKIKTVEQGVDFTTDFALMGAGFSKGAKLVEKHAVNKGLVKAPTEIKTQTIETTERQFNVLEGVEQTKIDTLGTERNYLKIKTRVAGEKELNSQDLQVAESKLSSDKRVFDVNYVRTRSLTDSALNTEIKTIKGKGTLTLSRPSIIKAEQKTLFGEEPIIQVDKGKWQADLSGIPEINKFTGKKAYGVENYLGKETFDYDFATKVDSIRIRPLREIPKIPEHKSTYPQGAEQFFDIPKEPKQLTLSENFGEIPDQIPTIKYRSQNLLPGETPGYKVYEKIRINDNTLRNTATKISTSEGIEGTKLPESTLKSSETSIEVTGNKAEGFETATTLRPLEGTPSALIKVKEPKTILGEWKKDIILEEIEPKTTIEVRSYEVPRTRSQSWDWVGVPFALPTFTLSIETQDSLKTNNLNTQGIWAQNAPKINIEQELAKKSNTGLQTSNIERVSLWEGTQIDTIVRTEQKQDQTFDIQTGEINNQRINPIIKPIVIPVIDTKIDTTIIPPPPTKPDPFNWITPPPPKPIPDPFTWIIPPPPKPIIPDPLGGGGGGIFGGIRDYSPRRKTKNKTIKNAYGDPFSQKTIL